MPSMQSPTPSSRRLRAFLSLWVCSFLAATPGQGSPPLRIHRAQWGPNGLALSFASQAGVSYRIEQSDNLVHWQEVGVVAGSGAMVDFVHAVGGVRPHSYYRLVQASPVSLREIVRFPSPARTAPVENEEMVRNGGFDFGLAGWARQSDAFLGPTASIQAARHAGGSGLEMNVDGNPSGISSYATVLQVLHLPQNLTQAEFAMDYRLEAKSDSSALGGLVAALGYLDEAGQLQVLSECYRLPHPATLQPGWQRVNQSLGATALVPLTQAQSQAKQVLLILALQGIQLRLSVDNVSFRIDGARPFPAFDQGILYSVQENDQWQVYAISPDGQKRRAVYRSSSPPGRLGWNASREALVFASRQQAPFSRWNSDLYVLSSNGVRRLTNPPGIEEWRKDSRPTGSVELTVRNGDLFNAIQVGVWVEGGRGGQVTGLIQAGGLETLRLDQVIDVGADSQYVVVRNFSTGRVLRQDVLVQVQAGQTTRLPEEILISGAGTDLVAASPSWHPSEPVILFTVAGSLMTTPASGGLGRGLPLNGASARWSPGGGQFVYDPLGGSGLYLGSTGPGAVPQHLNIGEASDPAWLPDASGLLYHNGVSWGDLFRLRLADGHRIQLTHLAEQFREFISGASVSPDGQFAVLERTIAGEAPGAPAHRELWILSLAEPWIMWPLVREGQPSAPLWAY